MRVSLSRWQIAIIASVAVALLGLQFLPAPARPKVAAAGPAAGIAATCVSGSRTGQPDLDDNLKTTDGLKITVRTPSDYDATRAYPMLFVYPPGGYDRRRSEIFYDLTTEATRRGFIVAYSDHLPLSDKAVSHQAKAPEAVEALFCIDAASIAYLGHSDGGSMAEGIPAFAPAAGVAPRAIVASAAGITGEDLGAMKCPSVSAVLIVHNRADRRFPDFGRGAATYWGTCAACSPEDLDTLADGCRDFSKCAEGHRVTYCETPEPHKRWPSMNSTMLNFIQGRDATP